MDPADVTVDLASFLPQLYHPITLTLIADCRYLGKCGRTGALPKVGAILSGGTLRLLIKCTGERIEDKIWRGRWFIIITFRLSTRYEIFFFTEAQKAVNHVLNTIDLKQFLQKGIGERTGKNNVNIDVRIGGKIKKWKWKQVSIFLMMVEEMITKLRKIFPYTLLFIEIIFYIFKLQIMQCKI